MIKLILNNNIIKYLMLRKVKTNNNVVVKNLIKKSDVKYDSIYLIVEDQNTNRRAR